MSATEELKLLSLMTDSVHLSRVWEVGVREELFEDPINRFAFRFMVDYWLNTQMTQAPTWVVMEAEYPQLRLPDPVEESIDWLIGRLKNRFATNQLQEVIRSTLDRSAAEDPVSTLDRLWHEAYAASQTTAPRYSRIDIAENVDERRERYVRDVRDRALAGQEIGLPELDNHTRGVLPGELCAVAAYTKTGKSWLLVHAFVNAIRQGRRPLLFTLEMGIPEIGDRVDALYAGVSYQRLSQRNLEPEELIRLREYQDRMRDTPHRGLIERPQRGERTVKHMVARARQEGADFLLIDQLSFIDAEKSYSGDSALRMKHGDLVFELKDEISRESVGKVPCLMAVQLNRQAAARAVGGRGELHHFANSSMVEQTVDLALGLWRTQEMRANNAMGLDIIGSRRCDTRSWTLSWHLSSRSEISVREEFFDNDGQMGGAD